MIMGNKFRLALGLGASVFHCVLITGARESRPAPLIYFLLGEGVGRGESHRVS